MKILIIEDQKDLNSAIAKGLKSRGFAVDQVFDGKDGLAKATVNRYDTIVLDLNLPFLDGIQVGIKLREAKITTPIIALTARDSLKDKLLGFTTGFDDYLTKPFDFPELVARIIALVRRAHPNKEPLLITDKISLNPTTRQASIARKPVKLTKIEFNILEYLLRKKGVVVTNQEIIEHIWSEEADLLDPPIRSHIKNLRKKLGDKDLAIIETIAGVGYRIN